MSLLQRIFGVRRQRAGLDPLYRAAVAEARDPFWYRDGQVPDTMDGRFDMVAIVTALVLLRLEDEGEAGRTDSVLLAELFVDDMDGELRQLGIGDHIVGKHIGRMMSALGGRLGALREAKATGDYRAVVVRNVFHEAPPSDAAVDAVAGRLQRLAARLAATSAPALREGRIAAS